MTTNTIYQNHIDIINSELSKFSAHNNSAEYRKAVMCEDEFYDYISASLEFKKFSVFFKCTTETIGYSFLEPSFAEIMSDTKNSSSDTLTYEALFKFDFSQKLFSIYEIHNIIENTSFKTLCFHYIKNEHEALNALHEILEFINNNIDKINSISSDENLQIALLNNNAEDKNVLSRIFGYETVYGDPENECGDHDSIELESTFQYLKTDLQGAIEKYALTGKTKALIRRFEKLERKNELFVFEKRFRDYLYENNFPEPEEKYTEHLKKQQKKSNLSGIVLLLQIIATFLLSFGLIDIATEACVAKYHKDALFLGTTDIGISVLDIGISVFLIILSIFGLLTFIRNRIPVIEKNTDKLFNIKDKPLAIVSALLLVTSTLIILNSYKNNAIVLKSDGVYIENKFVESKEDLTFIYIEGQSYLEDGEIIYEDAAEYRSLIMVFNKDFENFRHVELCPAEHHITDDIIEMVKASGYDFETFKTLDDFGKKHGLILDYGGDSLLELIFS